MIVERCLPAGLPVPQPERDGLSAPYWEGLRAGELRLQRCRNCGAWQWGPEWLCYSCHSLDLGWEETKPRGRIYSWARAWHPVQPALTQGVPYVYVLVALDEPVGVRLIGNLVGDPTQDVVIGQAVEGVFEYHPDGEPPYSLLQWRAT